jgi:predicted nucleic acid-binding protein
MVRKPVTPTIVDSNVLIDAIRNRQPALRFLEAAASAGAVWSSVLVRSELWVGSRPGENDRIEDLLGRIAWHDVTPSIADHAGRLGAPFRLTHHIGVVDLVLAATAIELGGTVATLNVRDFPMFPGLQPPY